MRYSAKWQDDALNVAPEERATVAEFRFYLDEQNVCLHFKGTKSSDRLVAPLYNVADGIAHEWWTIFGGRAEGLSLLKYRNGFLFPDVRFAFDGETFEVCAHQQSYSNPEVRFWGGPKELLSRADAEAKLSQFIDFVLHRLNEKAVGETSLSLRWERVRASREDPEEAIFCEAAGALGVDPYQIDDDTAATIEDSAELFEGEALTEFLAGARNAQRTRLIEWVRQVEQRPKYKSRVPDLRLVAEDACRNVPVRAGEKSWALGYRRAREMRRLLGFQIGRRFRTYKALAKVFGAKNYDSAPSVDGIRLLRSDKDDACHLHLRKHGNSEEAHASQLFSFARGVGDVACFSSLQRSPVNSVHFGYRQAAGRAFAAEFLAPVDEVEAMEKDGRDAVSIADEFCVSTAVINLQLENVNRIRAACE